MDYLDFELEIGESKGREYPVRIIHSPAGEAREIMRFPFDQIALENRLKDLQIALLRSGGKRRRILGPGEQIVQQFGSELFEALFTNEIRNRYDVSLREATRQPKGLRLKFRIRSPELAALPWEYLYDKRIDEYISLSRITPIVRYPELPQSIQLLTVTLPLRILGMVASPNELSPLNVKDEKQRVEEAVESLQQEGLVELKWLAGQTWRDLQQEMCGGPWHVFHYIGHGGFNPNSDEGFIALADQQGQEHHLSASQLSRLLADHISLRLVLLNSCEGARGSEHDIFSSIASVLIRRGIPAVIAMQYEISDPAAIEFARSFYESLALGLPVDASVSEARKAISIEIPDTLEWGIPALYMRAPDGRLYDVESIPPQKIPGEIKDDHKQRFPQSPLRFSSRKKELSVNDVTTMLKQYDFFDAELNRSGRGFKHQFEIQTIHGDNVVIDHASGLMWQQGGSATFISFEKAKEWVTELNQKRYAGFHNWRLPTLEEAMSLMEPERNKDDQYIELVFDNMQGSLKWIWTYDLIKGENRPWIVGFELGKCYHGPFAFFVYVRAVRSERTRQLPQ